MFYITRKINIKQACSSLYVISKGFHYSSIDLSYHEFYKRNIPKFSMTLNNQQSLKYCNLSASCWYCKAPRENTLFCSSCSSIQKPILPMDFFELLNVDKLFEVDEKKLVNNFKKLQMILHPDKFSLKSKEEQAIAEEFSALVNKAYFTLRHPLSRGIYILESLGQFIEEESSVDDPSFLYEIMELNEAVENSKTLEDIKVIDQEVRKLSLQSIDDINKAFKNNQLLDTKKLLIKLRYYTNIMKKASEKLLEFGFVKD